MNNKIKTAGGIVLKNDKMLFCLLYTSDAADEE